ncbi:MAG: tetratricopeptide repeat protein [Treponema sp.]|nr:tetratricopeptide repeat protein [Treponema sp.]
MIPKYAPLLFLTLFCLPLGAQNRASPEELLKTGISLYGEGKFAEAAVVLNFAALDSGVSNAKTAEDALYWKAMAQLSGGEYEKALDGFDALAKRGVRQEDIPYQRGRCQYYLGNYEQALVSLGSYASGGSDPARAAAAHYWMGESLLALGQLDKAADAFSLVVERYPSSVKYEASKYRLDVINQKKVEAELLAILKWSHEESLKNMEEYQRREKTYDEAIRAYQERLGILIGESEAAGDEQVIAELEANLDEASRALEEMRQTQPAGGVPFVQPKTDADRTILLLELKAAVLELSNNLNKRLNGEK